MMFTSSLHILYISFRKCILWCNGVMNIYPDCGFLHYTTKTNIYIIKLTGAILHLYTKPVKLPGLYEEV